MLRPEDDGDGEPFECSLRVMYARVSIVTPEERHFTSAGIVTVRPEDFNPQRGFGGEDLSVDDVCARIHDELGFAPERIAVLWRNECLNGTSRLLERGVRSETALQCLVLGDAAAVDALKHKLAAKQRKGDADPPAAPAASPAPAAPSPLPRRAALCFSDPYVQSLAREALEEAGWAVGDSGEDDGDSAADAREKPGLLWGDFGQLDWDEVLAGRVVGPQLVENTSSAAHRLAVASAPRLGWRVR